MKKDQIQNVMIFGAGYVGFSLAVLLSMKYRVVLIDIDEVKINKINNKQSPIHDSSIQENFYKKDLNLVAATDFSEYINEIDLAIIALPTNFDEQKQAFNTSIIDNVISNISYYLKDKFVVIKSTVPIGYTESLINKFPENKFIFSPEFLREGQAIQDNIFPSRIVIGSKHEDSEDAAKILLAITKNSPKVYFMEPSEAEAVKLFSNSYLASRVSFFNELDSFCMDRNLDTKKIINAVSADSRIGDSYNNPSFGYGGYCLPKDTKQLASNFQNTPQVIFNAVIESNKARKEHIANYILNKRYKTVGIYRLIMKSGSDNFRESAVFDIIKKLKKHDVEILIFEKLEINANHLDCPVIQNLGTFKQKAEIILANRFHKELEDVSEKVFTRDIYGGDE